jgi:hypothetical protein
MGKTKKMFEQMREAELNEHLNDEYLDDEYQFNKWLQEVNQVNNTNKKDSVEILNNLFGTFEEIFRQKSN